MSRSFYRSLLDELLHDKLLLSSLNMLDRDLEELSRIAVRLLERTGLLDMFASLFDLYGEVPYILYESGNIVHVIALPVGTFETLIPRCRWILWYGKQFYSHTGNMEELLVATPLYWTPLLDRFVPKFSTYIIPRYYEELIPRGAALIRNLELYYPLNYARDIILASLFDMFYNSLDLPYRREAPEKLWELLREYLKQYEKVSNIPIMFYIPSYNPNSPAFTLNSTMGWDEFSYETRGFLERYGLKGHYPPMYIVLPEEYLTVLPINEQYRIYPAQGYMLSRVSKSPPEKTTLLTPNGEKIILENPAASITIPSILTGEPVRVDLYKYKNIVFPLY